MTEKLNQEIQVIAREAERGASNVLREATGVTNSVVLEQSIREAAKLARTLAGRKEKITKRELLFGTVGLAAVSLLAACRKAEPVSWDRVVDKIDEEIKDSPGFLRLIFEKVKGAWEINFGKEKGYYGPEKKRVRKEVAEDELAKQYLAHFQKEETTTTPWQIDNYDVMYLTAIKGPGWWAQVPHFKSLFQKKVGRSISDEEWQDYQQNPQEAIKLIEELWSKESIKKEVYDFYSLPSEQVREKIKKEFPGLLPD